MTLPSTLLKSLAAIVGEPHVLTGDATAGFAVAQGCPGDLNAPSLP